MLRVHFKYVAARIQGGFRDRCGRCTRASLPDSHGIPTAVPGQRKRGSSIAGPSVQLAGEPGLFSPSMGLSLRAPGESVKPGPGRFSCRTFKPNKEGPLVAGPLYLAGGPGFEPGLTESESVVLPLDDPPIKAVASGKSQVARCAGDNTPATRAAFWTIRPFPSSEPYPLIPATGRPACRS